MLRNCGAGLQSHPYTLKFLHAQCRTCFTGPFLAVGSVLLICRPGATGVPKWWSRHRKTPLHPKFIHGMCRICYISLYLAVGIRLAYLPTSMYRCCENVEQTSNAFPRPTNFSTPHAGPALPALPGCGVRRHYLPAWRYGCCEMAELTHTHTCARTIFNIRNRW